jgi:hypothetical protein
MLNGVSAQDHTLRPQPASYLQLGLFRLSGLLVPSLIRGSQTSNESLSPANMAGSFALFARASPDEFLCQQLHDRFRILDRNSGWAGRDGRQ